MSSSPHPTMISLPSLVTTLCNAAMEACEIIMQVHQTRAEEGIGTVNKAGDGSRGFDPQTVADRRSEEAVIGLLRRDFPDICIVGEESGRVEVEEAVAAKVVGDVDVKHKIKVDVLENARELFHVPMSSVAVWVDPLDGTREFTESKMEFVTVLLGVSVNGEAMAGVIAHPLTGKVYFGLIGLGTFEVLLPTSTTTASPCTLSASTRLGGLVPTSTTTPTKKPRTTLPPSSLHCIVSRSRAYGVIHHVLDRLRHRMGGHLTSSQAGGCGAKILKVLQGQVDCYPFPTTGTSRWDICAGEALIRAIGGGFLDKYGRRIQYDVMATNFDNADGMIVTADDAVCEWICECFTGTVDLFRTVKNPSLFIDINEWLAVDSRLKWFEAPVEWCKRSKHGCTTLVSNGDGKWMLTRVSMPELLVRFPHTSDVSVRNELIGQARAQVFLELVPVMVANRVPVVNMIKMERNSSWSVKELVSNWENKVGGREDVEREALDKFSYTVLVDLMGITPSRDGICSLEMALKTMRSVQTWWKTKTVMEMRKLYKDRLSLSAAQTQNVPAYTLSRFPSHLHVRISRKFMTYCQSELANAAGVGNHECLILGCRLNASRHFDREGRLVVTSSGDDLHRVGFGLPHLDVAALVLHHTQHIVDDDKVKHWLELANLPSQEDLRLFTLSMMVLATSEDLDVDGEQLATYCGSFFVRVIDGIHAVVGESLL